MTNRFFCLFLDLHILAYRDNLGTPHQGVTTICLLPPSGCWLILPLITLVCTNLWVVACIVFRTSIINNQAYWVVCKCNMHAYIDRIPHHQLADGPIWSGFRSSRVQCTQVMEAILDNCHKRISFFSTHSL